MESDETPEPPESFEIAVRSEADPREWLSPEERARLRFVAWQQGQHGHASDVKDLALIKS